MDKALVSIVVNNYNYEAFLQQAIDSALNQTYENIEVIVVDDGSTDKSLEIIESYAGSISPVFKENGGQASTFNAGFYASKGEYVCYLDADDLLLPDSIENALKLFDGPNVVKVHWPMWVIDGDNQRNGKLMPKEGTLEGDRRDVVLTKGAFYDWHLNPPTSGNLWARWYLQLVLPVPEKQFPLGADGYLHTVAPVYGIVHSTTEPNGYYRIHTTNNYFRKRLDDNTVRFYQKRFEDYFAAFEYHFKKQGVQVDPEAWKKENFNYVWLQRLVDARKDLQANVAAGSHVLLIDNNELGDQFGANINVVPFLEKDGEYGGSPDDDAAAIAEVERQIAAGVKYLVIWWTAFWWLEYYSGFAEYLKKNYKAIISGDHLIAYYLQN